MTELAASNTSRQAEVTNTDRIILERIGKVIASLRHGTNEHANALLLAEILDVVSDADDGGVETQRHLAAVGGQVVGDGVLDDFKEFFLRRGGADGEAVEQLDHETGEALEGSGDADSGADFDEDALCGRDVDLESAGFVDGRVEEGEEALVDICQLM